MTIKDRGFGTLKRTNPKRLREISSRGGHIAHELGVAHKFDSVSGRAAAKKSPRCRKTEPDA